MAEILITGASGRIGKELVKQLGADSRTNRCEVIAPGRKDFNQLNLEETVDYVIWANPNVIVNLAANTNVKSTNPREMSINDNGVLNLLTAASKLPRDKVLFIQGSTNMVNDGRAGRPYKSSDPLQVPDCDLTPYAESKLHAEYFVKMNNIPAEGNLVWAIVRFAHPVFPQPVPGGDYLSRWADINADNTIMPFVDQQVSLSYGPHITQAIIDLMFLDNPAGVWHFTSKDHATPWDIVTKLYTRIGRPVVGLEEGHLTPALEKSYPRMAALDTGDLAGRGISRDLGTIEEIIDREVWGWKGCSLVPWSPDKKYSLAR